MEPERMALRALLWISGIDTCEAATTKAQRGDPVRAGFKKLGGYLERNDPIRAPGQSLFEP